MGKLHQEICRLVGENRYIIGQHAAERLEDRGIMEWSLLKQSGVAKLVTVHFFDED
jgi:hypothetical protein